jgi:hypothetical protein
MYYRLNKLFNLIFTNSYVLLLCTIILSILQALYMVIGKILIEIIQHIYLIQYVCVDTIGITNPHNTTLQINMEKFDGKYYKSITFYQEEKTDKNNLNSLSIWLKFGLWITKNIFTNKIFNNPDTFQILNSNNPNIKSYSFVNLNPNIKKINLNRRTLAYILFLKLFFILTFY